MIEQVHVLRFGCLRAVRIQLAPLHAFIGPNDTGKSTLLQALHLAAAVAARSPARALPDPLVTRFFDSTADRPEILAGFTGGVIYSLFWQEKVADVHEALGTRNDSRRLHAPVSLNRSGIISQAAGNPDLQAVAEQCRGTRLLRLDPDALREPSQLIEEGKSIGFADERGKGLPGVYDAIVNRGDDSFRKIADDVRTLFPTVKNLRLKTISSSTKVIEVELTDGKKVAANEMSEGLLYYLAFAAIPYLEPTSLLLVEEPENGLHPSRIADVVRALRAISENGTQIVMATHSPLVINELRPNEVSVFTRTEKGTVVTPIADTPRFAERSKVYALGELWLAYANGKDEAPLLTGEGTPA